MAKEFLTDEQVEAEIERLRCSEAVRLARREQRLKYKYRQVLYGLRNLEKRGLALMDKGVTLENMEDMLFGGDEDRLFLHE